MKSEISFIKELEEKAKDQQKLVETELVPDWAKNIGVWLGVNPWRVIVPMSAIIYFAMRLSYGSSFSEFVLELFGGFR